MKRRTAEVSKVRRSVKKTRITDTIYGRVSRLTLIGRFLVTWVSVLALDTLINFRFEFLWPVWLLMKDTYEILKYQGLEATILLTGLTVIADFLLLIMFPTRWLLFTASTYNCMQIACHSERLNSATLFIWMVFVYNEATVRAIHLPIYLELCLPLAAHSIGHSLVTIGRGIINYLKYQMIRNKQLQIHRDKAIISSINQLIPTTSNEHTKEALNRIAGTAASDPSLSAAVAEKLQDWALRFSNMIKHKTTTVQSIHKSKVKSNPDNNVINARRNEDLTDKINKTVDKKSVSDSDSNVIIKTINHTNRSSSAKNFAGKVMETSPAIVSSKNLSKDEVDDDYVLPTNPRCDQSSAALSEKNNKTEINYESRECKPEQIELDSLVIQYQEEKAARLKASSIITNLEIEIKKVKDDLKQKDYVEQELRQQLKLVEESRRTEAVKEDLKNSSGNRNRSISSANKDSQSKKNDKKSKVESSWQKKMEPNLAINISHDSCRLTQATLEKEKGMLLTQLHERQDQLRNARQEFEVYRHQNQTEISRMKKEIESLKCNISSQQEKNIKLENDLKSETRIKMDMFEHMGIAKHEKELIEAQLQKRDKEITALRAEMVELMAVGSILQPSNGVTNFGSTEISPIVTASPHFIGHHRPMMVDSLQSNTHDSNRYPSGVTGHIEKDRK
ncbi:Macoilin [Trichoplax sp. H2]|nr:Macoilin [Trichoplax sp. H2]|eukprot:RDD39190.1 Macoilin [Trichoplax sp. H2]